MYTLLKEHAENLRHKAAEFTSELVSIPSTSSKEKKAAKLVEKKMKELGYDKVITDDFGNVFGILYGYESKPALLLNSHIDTVIPDENDKQWNGSPYSGKIENIKFTASEAPTARAGWRYKCMPRTC